MVTAAFGTTASLASVTTPEIVPVRTWPYALARRKQAATSTDETTRIRLIKETSCLLESIIRYGLGNRALRQPGVGLYGLFRPQGGHRIHGDRAARREPAGRERHQRYHGDDQ